ncbi:hypothetical protein BN135_1874 [Cronobacter muytjensii 530]
MQIACGDVARDSDRLRERARNAAHQPERDDDAGDKRQRHRDKQHGAGLLILLKIARFGLPGQQLRLFQRFGDHLVNHPGRLAINAADLLIDALGARHIGDVILRNRRQIAFFQLVVQRDGLAYFIGVQPQLRQQRRQAV